MPLFAEVILPLSIPNTLTYGVPVEMVAKIAIGMRVEVAVGKNKIYTGVVAALHHSKPEVYAIKPIRNIPDAHPIIHDVQLRFWQWISQYYVAPPGAVMQAALPAHLKPSAEVSLLWTGLLPEHATALSDEAFIAAEALQLKKELSLTELRQITGAEQYGAVIEALLNYHVATISEALEPAYQPKVEKVVSIESYYKDEQQLSALFDRLQKAPKQLELLMSYLTLSKTYETVAQKELLEKANATSAQLKKLVEQHVFSVREVVIDRLPIVARQELLQYELTEAQSKALLHLQDNMAKHRVSLLQGVTGSGKTLLYIELIKATVAQGKQVLFLLPEIALTTHLVSRLQGFFAETLGVYHSRFSNHERVEIWEKVRSGKHKVVVGARSALWLPFDKLGLIVVDEEHDASFKQQEPAPRFHARDAAIALAALHADAKVILGSATPALETLYNVTQNKYGCTHLEERYQSTPLPDIKLVPAKSTESLRSKGIRTLTPALLESINEALAKREQVILFQNRRGYAPFQICTVCGWIPHCKNCAVSLTYHRTGDNLRCHYCGLKAAPMLTCPTCGSNRIIAKTFGTEKIEDEIKAIFPTARVARMDIDSMRGKNNMQQLLQQVSKRQVDIIIGTQMVAKGLDFKGVSLVGIIAADGLLSYPDFRVNERAFQLMEQVSGRAGRDEAQGKVLIQVYKEDHPVLQWVKNHSVAAYYQHEIAFRRMFYYPPFVRLIKLTAKHTREEKGAAAMQWLAQQLSTLGNITLHGPNPALVPRVRNQFVFELLLKMPKDKNVIAQTKAALVRLKEEVQAQRGLSGVQIIIDVDPM